MYDLALWICSVASLLALIFYLLDKKTNNKISFNVIITLTVIGLVSSIIFWKLIKVDSYNETDVLFYYVPDQNSTTYNYWFVPVISVVKNGEFMVDIFTGSDEEEDLGENAPADVERVKGTWEKALGQYIFTFDSNNIEFYESKYEFRDVRIGDSLTFAVHQNTNSIIMWGTTLKKSKTLDAIKFLMD